MKSLILSQVETRLDSTWWFVIVSTLEFHVGYSHKQGTPKGTNV